MVSQMSCTIAEKYAMHPICPYCGCIAYKETIEELPRNICKLILQSEGGQMKTKKCIGCGYSIIKITDTRVLEDENFNHHRSV